MTTGLGTRLVYVQGLLYIYCDMIDMVKAWECGYPYCVIPVSVYHQLLEVTANIKALGIFISLQQYVWQGAIQLEVTAPLQDSASATKAGQATCVVSAFLHPAAILRSHAYLGGMFFILKLQLTDSSSILQHRVHKIKAHNLTTNVKFSPIIEPVHDGITTA